jgi:1-deoxy-D-xylulose-5-phosphate reductoisomerase
LIPIDSEHNAIFQCLPAGFQAGVAPRGVRRLILTASGGPFLHWTAEALASATPAQACAHPRWNMGRKISVDSATLMNKGLELIEASVLFGMPASQIDIVVHPQSLVHSLVEYEDGSVLAQLSSPDMRVPIAQALAWPHRMAAGVEFLDLVRSARLDFLAPDPQRFPCLRHAQEAARLGGLSCASLNAADEIAVQAFLDKQLNFGDIPAVIESVMGRVRGGMMTGLEAVLAADGEARALASEVVARRAGAQSVQL